MKTTRSSGKRVKAIDDLVPAVRKLGKLLEESCAEPGVVKECSRFLMGAQEAIKANDVEGVVNQIDLFILSIQRQMGTEISLRKAFEFADVAIIDLKRHVGHPAQIFAEAQAFGLTFLKVASASDTPLNLAARPIRPGVKETQQVIKKAIRSYHLPAEPESQLLKLTDQMSEMALAFRPGATKPEDELRFITTLIDFHTTLTSLQGVYITTTQVNYLMGLVLFAVPAWLCAVPYAWIAQAVIVVVGLVFLGIYYSFRSTAAKLAARNISRFIELCTHSTTEVADKVKEETKDLSEEDKKDVRKGLEKAHDKPTLTDADDKIHRKLQAAIDELPS